MSWSFSVNEKNKDDAAREFDNELAKHEQHIPNAISNALHNAAKELCFNAKSNQPCVISSAGHFNGDGTGNAEVRVIVKPYVEVLPGSEADTNEA